MNDELTRHVNAELYENLTFNASDTFDIEGDELTFHWDFNDGNTSDEKIVEYNFTNKSTYQVTLTVTETGENGLEETEKITVTVTDSENDNQKGN